MPISNLLTKPCTITRRSASATLIDESGDAVITTTTAATVCELQRLQRADGEPESEGELSDTLWTLFLPTGTAIDTGDRVTVGGVSYEMFGAPWDAKTGSPSMWHIEATVRRTAGAGDIT